MHICLDLCGSVGWALSRQAKGLILGWGACLSCAFLPGWGVCRSRLINVSLSHQRFSPSLSPSLPLSLKIDK